MHPQVCLFVFFYQACGHSDNNIETVLFTFALRSFLYNISMYGSTKIEANLFSFRGQIILFVARQQHSTVDSQHFFFKQSLWVPYWQGRFLSFICIKLLGTFIAAKNKDIFILKFSTEDQFRYHTPNFTMVRNFKVIVLITHL